MNTIELFKNNKIRLDDKEYKQDEFHLIAADNDLVPADHPFLTNAHTIAICCDCTLNGIRCRGVMFEAIDNFIIDIITYPYNLEDCINACQGSGKTSIKNIMSTQLIETEYDDVHKITFAPDGSMLYIWS